MAELSRTHHSKFVRFLLRFVGWPVAPSTTKKTGHRGPSHERAVDREVSPPGK
jgi:hypothetical protein